MSFFRFLIFVEALGSSDTGTSCSKKLKLYLIIKLGRSSRVEWQRWNELAPAGFEPETTGLWSGDRCPLHKLFNANIFSINSICPDKPHCQKVEWSRSP